MLSGSCPSTYQQQIRNINSLMVDVSVPSMNTLHGMPSLLHLSSTQSELGNCNVNYFEFDNDLPTPASVDDQVNTNDDSLTDPIIEKCSFQRSTICLPLDIAFQVHLLSQMNEHRGNSKFSLGMLTSTHTFQWSYAISNILVYVIWYIFGRFTTVCNF
jgi:hypothetical protein